MFDTIFKIVMILTVIGLISLFVIFLVKYLKHKSVSIFYLIFWGIVTILAIYNMIDIWGSLG